MRVLHVNKFLYRRGGAEAYMLDLAALQAAHGDEVAFFGMTHPDNDPAVAGRYAHHLPSYLELDPPPPGAVGRARAIARMVWSRQSEAGLAATIADFHPDVVHLHNIYHQLSPSLLAATRKARVPAVMTLHDYKLVCPSFQLLDHGRPCTACLDGHFRHALARRCKSDSLGATAALVLEASLHRRFDAYGSVSAFISPSRFLAQTVSTNPSYAGRVRHVPHFVDVPPTAEVPPRSGRFLYAGRLSHEKGIGTLLRALELCGDGVQLDVAGDGPERGALESLARDVAPGRVRFLGRCTKDDVLALMRRAVAVVVPSEWYENQPMVVLEAMSCATPVVCSDLGGLPELIADGVTGRVVGAGDPRALAAALEELASDLARAESLGRAARAEVERDFAPRVHLERVREVYRGAGARTEQVAVPAATA